MSDENPLYREVFDLFDKVGKQKYIDEARGRGVRLSL